MTDNTESGTPALLPGEVTTPSVVTCPVAYCRGGHEPGGLHDIPPCLDTCGPIRPVLGRKHDRACPNAGWRRP